MRATCIFLAIALALVQTAAAVTDADRAQAYKEFRELFDAHKYEEARSAAEKLVALTEEQYGASDRELVNPLSNLATTAYRLKDFATAEKNYLRGIEILEATAGNADRQLLRPLHGLGATYLAQQEYEDAAVRLKRAVDLSRNLDGLFNVEQLEYLEPLIASYVALGRSADTEKEQQYVLRIDENTYGKTDVRLLEPLDRYARWLESVGRYTSARTLHNRAIGIAEQSGGKGSVLVVTPLQGLARTYRLEFLNGSEQAPEADSAFAGGDGLRTEPSNTERLNADGERALKLALQVIDAAKPVDHKLRGTALIELGDWYLCGDATAKGIENYREAWRELAQVDATVALETPRLIAYRPPSSSEKRSTLDPDSADPHYVEVGFTVTTDGHTKDITVVGTDAPAAVQKAVLTAVKKARYGPRFAQGEPLETPGITMREKVLLHKNKKESKR